MENAFTAHSVTSVTGQSTICAICYTAWNLLRIYKKKENNLKKVVTISINKDRQFTISSQNYSM